MQKQKQSCGKTELSLVLPWGGGGGEGVKNLPKIPNGNHNLKRLSLSV